MADPSITQLTTKKSTTYAANCHCGAIKYSITLEDALAPEGSGLINQCNCSICTKNGYLLIYPKREDVIFHDDCDAKLKDYFFASKEKPHKFCGECGSSILIDFRNSRYKGERPFLAINARMLKDFDLEKAEFKYFDGRGRLEPQYSV